MFALLLVLPAVVKASPTCAIDPGIAGEELAISGSKLRFVGLTPVVTRRESSDGVERVAVTAASTAYSWSIVDGVLAFEKAACVPESDAAGPRTPTRAVAAAAVACAPGVGGKALGALLLAGGARAQESCEDVVEIDVYVPGGGGGDACDVDAVELADFEVWRREEGYWWGEYTFLGAEGDPYASASWNYGYDHYWGFIHLELAGNSLRQRNVFVYPPSAKCDEDPSVSGAGECGVNGNERIFSADQSASDCDGNLAGPYVTFGLTVDTTTTVLGDDTVVYSVKLPGDSGGAFKQNKLTTLPGNGVRVCTAQGFSFGAEQPEYASYYREYKLANRTEWLAKLAEVRAANGILDSDHCAWVSGSPPESGTTCAEHFGFDA